VRAGDFYTETVLPALAERLDQAFPEFGWRRDRHGWVATNEQHTHARLGVRAERVVAHGSAPPGFLVHGGEPMLWTAYLNGGNVPRGADFLRAVRQLAERAAVDPVPLENRRPRDRRADLLHDFFELCRRELATEGGAEARAYLERRGLPAESIAESGLGLVPDSRKTRSLLERSGYTREEIANAGILADSRWPGRLCGAWRNDHGKIGTLWARSPDSQVSPDTRYLYLRGASRTTLPPYGLCDLLARPHNGRREIVLVEGIFDLHQLRASAIENVAALGGTSVTPQTFERLHRLGVDVVTLSLDNDEAGRAAAARAIEHSARARRSPELYVIDPTQLGAAKDPDELVRERGPAAWLALLETRACGIAWRACELAAVTRNSPAAERRAALARAGRWLGTLPPRLALEQEDAIRLTAELCGYSTAALQRAFRARFWNPPQRGRQWPRLRADGRAPGLDRTDG
jgi:Toprim-like/DNA primase catalytic core, N-terminal domain